MHKYRLQQQKDALMQLRNTSPNMGITQKQSLAKRMGLVIPMMTMRRLKRKSKTLRKKRTSSRNLLMLIAIYWGWLMRQPQKTY